MWWRSTYSCRWSSPVWNPLLFNVFSRICVRLFPSSIVQNNHFPAFTNPWVPLPVPVLPHLLEWRPVGLRCLDRLLQLLIRPGKTWTKSPRQWQITKNHKFKPRPRPGAPSSGLRSSSASWPGFPRRGNSSWQWHACQGCLFVGRRRAYFQQGWKYTIDFSQMTIREALKILFF